MGLYYMEVVICTPIRIQSKFPLISLRSMLRSNYISSSVAIHQKKGKNAPSRKCGDTDALTQKSELQSCLSGNSKEQNTTHQLIAGLEQIKANNITDKECESACVFCRKSMN